ncbi:MAG: aminotransferase class I/II-fold pyridoxal phosphate-dependent enzyme [Ignavibacteria bacterium]|nr:aminotransferase class I/II-fold pyridoxal phosphate-dependent enzyme [Ignavibacteria bacterium]
MVIPLSHIRILPIYQPGASITDVQTEYGLNHVEKLSSNENPLGFSQFALEAAQLAISEANVYNDGGLELRKALAKHYNCEIGNITVNSGSDAIIHQIMRTFLSCEDSAISSEGGFVSFPIAVAAVGAEAILTPMTTEFRFDVDAIVKSVKSNTKVIYIPNPNNPTGTYITADEFKRLMNSIPSDIVVVMDEAYYEYATLGGLSDFPSTALCPFENVVTLRTFSKAYGLASMRVGYAIGHESVIQHLLRTKLPFSPNGPACAAAVAALGDQEFVAQSVQTNSECLKILKEVTTRYTTSDSIANFIMIDCGSAESMKALHYNLLQNGFITRSLGAFGLPNCIRISTGTIEQTKNLTQTLLNLANENIGV